MSETRLTLALISAELSRALLWALTGIFFAGTLALTLGLGAVFVAFLPERYPPRGAARGKPLPRTPVKRVEHPRRCYPALLLEEQNRAWRERDGKGRGASVRVARVSTVDEFARNIHGRPDHA